MTGAELPADEMNDGPEEPSMERFPGLGLLWAGIGFIGIVLTAFLVIGLLLPGTWRAERERSWGVPPEAVFGQIADLENWEAWTHWPELQNVEARKEAGVGVERTWDDPTFGRGTLTLIEVAPNRQVRYEVRVAGGIAIDGSITLEATSGGTRVRWLEEGAFGRNPLLRYTALSMDDLQGDEMDKALDRLGDLVTQ